MEWKYARNGVKTAFAIAIANGSLVFYHVMAGRRPPIFRFARGAPLFHFKAVTSL